jgi:predicted metal-binding membrane protein
MPNPVVRIVRRDTLIIGFCLAIIVVMAWWWLAKSAGLGIGTPPGEDAMATMPAAQNVWTSAYLVPAFAMWAFMMVAMMLPSAAPMILLFARLSAQSKNGAANTAVFALSYLIIWLVFSVIAAASQAGLVSLAAASADSLKLVDGRLAGLLLVVAGCYQLSPLKSACLNQCRSPLSFFMRGWRPGWKGAVHLGAQHGLYCLGCCWVLMLLLFAAGVMNLAWIAALTFIVVAEKLAPPIIRVRQGIAIMLLLGGALMISGV